MRFRTHWTSIAAVTVATALLAGCGGGGSTSPAGSTLPGGTQSLLKMAHGGVVGPNASSKTTLLNTSGKKMKSFFPHKPITNTVFIGDATNGVIEMFDFKSKAMVGQIGGLSAPQGLATDVAGNLWEGDTGTQTINWWAPPYTGNPIQIHENGLYPVGLHVDSSNNLWVSNICSGSGGNCSGGGNTVEYKGGGGSPHALSGGPYRSYFVTTDANGNVWADGQDSNFLPTVGYWTGGKGSFHVLNVALNFPGSIQFDASGNLLLDDQLGDPNTGGSILDVVDPSTGNIKSQITIQTNGDDMIAVALGTAQARVFAPGYLGSTTNIVTYPGGTMANTFASTGNPASISLVPAVLP